MTGDYLLAFALSMCCATTGSCLVIAWLIGRCHGDLSGFLAYRKAMARGRGFVREAYLVYDAISMLVAIPTLAAIASLLAFVAVSQTHGWLLLLFPCYMGVVWWHLTCTPLESKLSRISAFCQRTGTTNPLKTLLTHTTE